MKYILVLVSTVFIALCLGFYYLPQLNSLKTPAVPQDLSILVAAEQNYPPFSFVAENGVYQGLSKDYLDLIEKKLKIKFTYDKPNNLANILEKAKTSQVDVVTSLTKTTEREAYLLFTTPYANIPAVILLSKSDSRENLTPTSLANKKVSLGKGYGVQSYLEKYFPNINLVTTPDDETAIQKLINKEVDAAITDIASASYIFHQHKISGIKIAGKTGFNYSLSLAITKTKPDLLLLLQSGIDLIKPDEREALADKWFNTKLNVTYTAAIKTLYPFNIIIFLSIFAGYYWNYQLQKTVKSRTRELENLKDNLQVEVAKAKSELIKKNEDQAAQLQRYERLNKVLVSREKAMIELKKQLDSKAKK